MPGAGKSLLASAAVEDLQHRLASASDLVVYAYFRYDSQTNQTPELVIPHLLNQAVKRCGKVSAELLALYKEYCNKVPRLDKIIDAFRLTIVGRRLYVVLDALDEYSVEDYDKVQPLINALLVLKAKLLVTSRHSVLLPANNFSSFEVHADSNDVRVLIVEHVKNSHRLATFIKDSPELLEEIVTKISEHTNGMFIIVRLVLELLSSQMTPHGVRKQLNHLPASLDRTYELTIERVHSQSPEVVRIADEAFVWVLYAQKPLSTGQLQHGVSFDTTERRIGSEYLIPIKDILAACCGLITLVDDKCQFVHFSTKDFFQKHSGMYLPGAERKITEKCLSYAAVAVAQLAELHSDNAIERKISDMSLCIYASSYWGHHASRMLEDFDEFEHLVEDLIKQPLWPKMVDKQKTIKSDASNLSSQHYLILYLARYGLIKPLRLFWKSNALAEAAPMSGVCLPDNPNLTRDRNGWAAIHYAAWCNHEEIVQFLIEQGVEVDQLTNWNETALHLSALIGHDSIALTLLDKGADPNVKAVDWNTPLYEATDNGHLLLATILLENGALPDMACKYGKTPLHVAARKGYDFVALTLLGKGADPNAQDKAGNTPLHLTIDNGHLSLATILLKYDALPDIASKCGRTPLHVAARKGYHFIALALLDKGADPNARDEDGDTPLHKATYNGHLSLATILLDNGARPDPVGRHGWTPLHVAASKGRESIALTLLGKGADPNAQDYVNFTPLHSAVENGHLTLARYFLADGADFRCTSIMAALLDLICPANFRWKCR